MFKQRRAVYLIKGNNRAKLKKPVKRRYYGSTYTIFKWWCYKVWNLTTMS